MTPLNMRIFGASLLEGLTPKIRMLCGVILNKRSFQPFMCLDFCFRILAVILVSELLLLLLFSNQHWLDLSSSSRCVRTGSSLLSPGGARDGEGRHHQHDEGLRRHLLLRLSPLRLRGHAAAMLVLLQGRAVQRGLWSRRLGFLVTVLVVSRVERHAWIGLRHADSVPSSDCAEF